MMRDTLPLPDGHIAFMPTLQLVADLETQFGSLLKRADDLVQKNLPLSQVLEMLCTVYRAAGCDMPDDRLRTYLWRGTGQSPVALLSDILLCLLAPLQKMDALADPGGATGEDAAARTAQR